MVDDSRERAQRGLVVVRPISKRLRLAVATQLPEAVVSGDELIVAAADLESSLRIALELRRWSTADPKRDPAVGVAAMGPTGDQTGDDLSRARELASAAAPGQVLVDATLSDSARPSWITVAPVASDDHAVELRWEGPGAPSADGDETAAGAMPRVPLPGPLASALDRPWPMLGRSAELDSVAAAWGRVIAGGREIVLIAGEPGAGKSRLAAEAAFEVHCAGGLVLYGSGEEHDGTPYAPFVEALSHLYRSVDAQALSGLRDSPLGRLIPGAAKADGEQSPAGLGDERGQLFASAVEQLERLPENRALLLVVDDLQGCSLTSLQLLEHLTRTKADVRLLVLATYRPNDLDPSDDRTRMIAGLRSAPGAQHIQLDGLEEPSLRGIAASLGVADDADELERAASLTQRETGGNPLFACELLRSLGQTSSGLDGVAVAPRSLRMLIAARGHELGDDAYLHISAAAVCGRSFAPQIVAHALDVPQASFAESMARAERAGLISIDPIDRSCTFAHAIAAHCLYEEVGPARRGQLHRRLAEALEEVGDSTLPDLAGEIARHWRQADPPDDARAARSCAAAGEQALGRYDHEVAAEWFEQALELRDRSRAPADSDRCDLLIGLGTALRFRDQERSRAVLLEAGRLADDLDDIDRLTKATLANHRGFVSHVGSFDRERGAMLRRAAERMTDSGPQLALVLAQLALELTFSPQVERRRRLAARALAVARASGDQRVVAQVLIRYLIAHWGPENPRDRIAAAAESIAISSQLDEPLDLFHGLHWQASAQLELGRVTDAARTLREQERIASRIGDETAVWLCECAASVHLALSGQLEEAEVRAQHAAELAERSAQPDVLPFYISQIASIRWQQGRLPELAPLLAQALDQYPGLPAFRSLVTLAHALAGDHAFAREVLVIDTATEFSELPRDPIWIAGAVTYAHAVAELGEIEAASMLKEILEPYRGQLATTTISVWGMVDHALGRLELLLGEEAQGRESLRRAIGDYAQMRAPVWRAQAERDLAGPAPPGVAGASLLDTRIARLGLTNRQAEVVRFVAQGLSNKEVAAEMQIALSTVKRHLENAYDRTGARSRGALIAMLLEADVAEGRGT